MFFGLDMEKLLLIAVLAAFLVGPERLPKLAAGLARFTKKARGWVNDAKSKVKDEMGDELNDIEWRKLDPRQYDPRRIIRDALLDDDGPATPTVVPPVVTATPPRQRLDPSSPIVFDTEAT